MILIGSDTYSNGATTEVCLSFNNWENQTRRMRRVIEDAIGRRSVLIGSLARDLPARVAVAVEPWEVAARDLQPDAVTR